MSPAGFLLLDLDGTVRKTISGKKFINEPSDQQLIAYAGARMHNWTEAGWKLYGVTNQGGVKAGFKTFDSMLEEQRRTFEIAPWLEAIFACPDDGQTCFRIDRDGHLPIHETIVGKLWVGSFRKPGAGMLLAARALICGDALKFLMVGDRPEDKAAAGAAGVPFLSAEDWWAGKCPEL